MRGVLTLITLAVIGTPFSASAQTQAGSSAAYITPMPLQILTWPGKVPTPQPQRQIATAAPVRPAAQPALPTSLYGPSAPRWRAAPASTTRDPTTRGPATQAAPQPAPAAIAAAKSTDGAPPHFYSLARQYGVPPDPIALSPQFLASTPQSDMAEPPPLPPPHTPGAQTANMSTAAATNQVRQAQEVAADADSVALGN
jgi:hypothetical protein